MNHTANGRMTLGLDSLLENNRQWAAEVEDKRPGFFRSLLQQQAPQWLWIGCADSRVPANELVGLQPGELFVHRNIANVVAHSDLNCLSVLQYAVDMLKVQHVAVVGHSGCGGVRAALDGMRIGIADNWVRHIRDVVEKHSSWLDTLAKEAKFYATCQLNVLEQTRNLCLTTVLQDAWARGQTVAVHGLIYGLHDGLLKSLALSVRSSKELDETYARAVAELKSKHASGFASQPCGCVASAQVLA
ncbi:carbonate dehydratase [Cupriavidus basilensis]|uniref:carbonate dehydratase n=1 Tax=Cupriavidus basilensis TaxID=68895 RepID=UPI0023E806BF|nr:carbonate dehydratase [Cupriavidus basilensis]MDF3881594.1 carbonate dehydratase [Cupriavidus basilensis]